MKRANSLLLGVSLALVTSSSLFGATVIVNDNFTAANVNSGFLLGEGANSGITPPTATRLTGTAAANLRYLKRGNKNDTAYTISGNKLNITQGSQSGRFTISEDGANPYDFSTALGIPAATPLNPQVYDVGIAMNNKVTIGDPTVGRMSFAFGTVEGGGGNWSFGIQIVPAVNAGTTNYNIYKRIKIASSGLGAELNSVITNAGAAATEMSFLIRVTDAGAETDTNYNSRIQLSIDSGATWIYDTQSDASLTNGFRFDTAARFVSFDQAPNSGADTYDNFSIALASPLIWTGATDANWSNGGNWLKGAPPVTGATVTVGDALVFSGTTQQANVNDITSLSVSSVTFSNGGFSAAGNAFTLTTAITNVVGDSEVNNEVILGANSRFHSVTNTLTVNGAVTSATRNLTVSGTGNTIINGTIATGTGSFTKQTSGGVVTLNANNTYTGNTTVSQGQLNINGSIASSNITISAAGILGGSGSVTGAVSVTGSLSAGNGIGKLITGNLSLNNNGTNIFEIGSLTGTPGINWDLIDAGTSNIDVVATSASPFKFRVVSVGLNTFNKDASYVWRAMSGNVLNFSADKFSGVTSAFTNDLAGGAFSVESDGSGLNVRYTPNQGPSASATNVSFSAGTPFVLPIAELLNNRTSDPDGDARVLVSVTSTNATVSTNATDITISSATATTESIAYVVRDARNYKAGDTVRMATNYINIVVTGTSGGGTLGITKSGANANLNFVGNSGQVYVIERSQNLTTWVPVYTNTAAVDGSIQYSEVPPTNPAFYRAHSQ